ncbi:hypothetical protein JCM10908_006587 [Rhodotorula pacifica]|uniref:uncharacterized protein n=1 Tax=Rhodotorula pacifica TaxID=1495444 RepID=UPI00317ED2E2
MTSCSSPPRPIPAPHVASASPHSSPSSSPARSTTLRRSPSPYPLARPASSPPRGLLPSFARDRRLPPPVPTSVTATDPREYTSTTLHGGWPLPGAGLGGLRPFGSAPSLGSLSSPAAMRALRPMSSTTNLPDLAAATSLSRRTVNTGSIVGTSASRNSASGYQSSRADLGYSAQHSASNGNGVQLKSEVQLRPATSGSRAGRESRAPVSPKVEPPTVNVASSRRANDYTVLRNDFDAQALSSHPAHHVFPPDDPRIPPVGHSDSSSSHSESGGAQTKRTIFTPYELSVLQALWATGAYYPAHWQVEEVQRRTGLTRVQIRNWFANRRQRSVGEEKARVIQMGNELAP